MGNGFTDVRLPYSEQWAKECVALLEADGWKTVPMGAENVAPNIQNALSLMKNPDSTARFVRYMPDGFAVNIAEETAFFFDAKRGKSIEKDAYIAYLAFAGDGRRVFVLIKNDINDIYYVPVHKLKFLCSYEYVLQFTENKRMPIDDDGWIAPRLWPKDRYKNWSNKYNNASGTPFKYFNFEAMAQYKRAGVQ